MVKFSTGSKVLIQTRPNIAAGSIIFKEIDEEYSNRALGHALELFEFGDKFRKEYHWSIPQARVLIEDG